MKNLAYLLLFSLIFITACDKDSGVDPDKNNAQSMRINHWGADFSENLVGSEGNDSPLLWDDTDGYITCWSPAPNTTDGTWGTALWYSPASQQFKMYNAGNVDLASITAVDETAWQTDFDLNPLVTGDVWVAQTRDGYVKFKVIDAPVGTAEVDAREHWYVDIEFVHSLTTTF
jgi:hypothetical protein